MLRLGREGFQTKVDNQLYVANYLREFLRNLKNHDGKPYFQMCDAGDDHGLPVVAARLNPELKLPYDDFDLQHGLAET